MLYKTLFENNKSEATNSSAGSSTLWAIYNGSPLPGLWRHLLAHASMTANFTHCTVEKIYISLYIAYVYGSIYISIYISLYIYIYISIYVMYKHYASKKVHHYRDNPQPGRSTCHSGLSIILHFLFPMPENILSQPICLFCVHCTVADLYIYKYIYLSIYLSVYTYH